MKSIAILLSLLLPSQAFAAEWSSDSMLPASLKLVGALTVVLGLVLILYYFSRKGFGFLPAPKTGAIKLVEARHLMPKKSLFLVEVRGRELLLGVGADRIELLTHLDWQPNASFEETLSEIEDTI
jgi:flagellar protein FliO/FliZ